MKSVIKSNTYNVISTDPFDIPLPLEFKLMNGNAVLATYEIHENGQVDYSFSTSAKEPILTSTIRPLVLNDIYFLFASRVFPDKTPFTAGELTRFGVAEYNPYEILRKTHGLMPIDGYWFKFPGEEHLNFKKVQEKFAEYFKPPVAEAKTGLSAADAVADAGTAVPEEETSSANDESSNSETIYSLDSILHQKSHEYTSIHDVSSILNESKLDVDSIVANIDNTEFIESVFAHADENPFEKKAEPEKEPEPEALPEEPTEKPAEVSSEPPAGGNMSPEAIAALLASAGAE